MFLKHISLTNFRIFKRLELDVPAHITVLVGNNAQGKTSFLEAINFFSTMTSVQAGKDRELINFLALDEEMPVARLVMEFTRANSIHSMEARLIIGNGGGNGNGRLRKEVLVDGIKRPLQQALGNFNSVIFLPQMTDIVNGAPEERRRYLDMTIAQVYPGYARELSEYLQAISQRNALLKILAERGGDASQLDFWDEQIAEKGSFIIHTRMQMLKEFEAQVTRVHLTLSEGKSPLLINYLPGLNLKEGDKGQEVFAFSAESVPAPIPDQNELQDAFIKRLRVIRKDEILRGVTTIGPHRDDLRFLIDQVDAGTYGSRGQIRTVVMALKIGEMYWLHEKTQEWPVLLLDETMAELDLPHRDALLGALGNSEQAILTATDESMFNQDFLKECTLMHVIEGMIQKDQ